MRIKLSLIFICFFYITAYPNKFAENGVLDLQQYDFQDDIVEFNGVAKFYWKKQLTNVRNTDTINPSLINMGYSWNNQPSNYKSYTLKGYGTYHIKINIGDINVGKQFILRPKHFIAYASEIYVNNKLISNNGNVGKSRIDSNYKPSRKTTACSFVADSAILDVFIQTANYNHFRSGIFRKIEFGYTKNMTEYREKEISSNLLIIVSLIAMGSLKYNIR